MAEVLQEVTVRLVQELVGSQPKVVVTATNVPSPLAGIDLIAAGIREILLLHDRMVTEAMEAQARVSPVSTLTLPKNGLRKN